MNKNIHAYPNKEKLVAATTERIADWHGYTGRQDDCGIFGLKDFGASAPSGELYKEFAFTTERVVQVAKNVIKKNKK